MNKNFKLAFQLASGFYAAKLLWEFIDSECTGLYRILNTYVKDFIIRQAQKGDKLAERICEVNNVRYTSQNHKEKEIIGFRKE